MSRIVFRFTYYITSNDMRKSEFIFKVILQH